MPAQRRYFRLKQEMKAGNWSLGDPLDERGQEVENLWAFSAGQRLPQGRRLSLPIDEPGRRLDFSLAGISLAPILHVRVATLFSQLAPEDVQLLPVDIPGHPDQYLMLVATKLVRCIDDAASKEVRYWTPEDGRPEKLGTYRSVVDLRIDPSRVGDAKVFRTWGWSIALIVSEELKTSIERAEVTGATFEEA
ncbi:hypothetical protein LZ198_10320 [Myxococcus sp. K15C18031901]|uniref:imm11 family protein n=1 Tax=Myxococcus dinghuensis TaxID=2906761 RepID=UPI0020A7D007|nr:DUF1629 domain-containing protein [Myxococcus dinghuensis]MCP3099265.1 hypothetical protein [Myxococcus dinghuensis]